MRTAILQYMFDLGYLISVPLGGWLFKIGSYSLVFGTGLGLNVLCLLVAFWRLWGFNEKIVRKDLTIQGKLKSNSIQYTSIRILCCRFDITNELDKFIEKYLHEEARKEEYLYSLHDHNPSYQ